MYLCGQNVKNSPESREKAKIGGIENIKSMTKVRRLSELSQSLPFTEYDFYDLYQKTFEGTELGRMKRVLPLRHPHRQRGTPGGTAGTTESGSSLAGSFKWFRKGVLLWELPDGCVKITWLSTKSGGYERFWPQKTEQIQPILATS